MYIASAVYNRLYNRRRE